MYDWTYRVMLKYSLVVICVSVIRPIIPVNWRDIFLSTNISVCFTVSLLVDKLQTFPQAAVRSSTSPVNYSRNIQHHFSICFKFSRKHGWHQWMKGDVGDILRDLRCLLVLRCLTDVLVITSMTLVKWFGFLLTLHALSKAGPWQEYYVRVLFFGTLTAGSVRNVQYCVNLSNTLELHFASFCYYNRL